MLLDMPDGGAEHFAKTVSHLKERYVNNVLLLLKLYCGILVSAGMELFSSEGLIRCCILILGEK